MVGSGIDRGNPMKRPNYRFFECDIRGRTQGGAGFGVPGRLNDNRATLYWVLTLGRDLDHGLADHLAVDQGAEGVGGLFHREAMRDVRAHDAELGETRQLLDVILRKRRRAAPPGFAGTHAEDAE